MQIGAWDQTQKRIRDIMQMLSSPQPPRFSASQKSFQTPSRKTEADLGLRRSPAEGRGLPFSGLRAKGASFSSQLQSLIEKEASRQGVDADLVKALIKVESGGRPRARSPKGALGLMQLMPETARLLGVDPHKPQENLSGGIRYLKAMARRFGDLDLALAAYNAGPGAVEKYRGVPPYKETRQYIQKIRQQL